MELLDGHVNQVRLRSHCASALWVDEDREVATVDPFLVKKGVGICLLAEEEITGLDCLGREEPTATGSRCLNADWTHVGGMVQVRRPGTGCLVSQLLELVFPVVVFCEAADGVSQLGFGCHVVGVC